METNKAARGSVEVELHGKNYTILELDLKELGDLENFIKSKYAKLYRQSADGVKAKEREKQVMEILRTSYTPDELTKETRAYDVLYYICFLALRSNPGVTLESMSDILDQSNLEIVTTAMDSFGEDSENPPETTEENC